MRHIPSHTGYVCISQDQHATRLNRSGQKNARGKNEYLEQDERPGAPRRHNRRRRGRLGLRGVRICEICQDRAIGAVIARALLHQGR